MALENLYKIALKKRKYVIGLMSGTSLDGIDAALVEIQNSGTATKLKLLNFVSPKFPNGVSEIILKNSLPGKNNVSDICRLNFLLPHLYYDATKLLLKKDNFPIEKIDLIGTHGQTVHHLPLKQNYFGHTFGSTLQIGDPSVLAKLSGIITIGDFRTGDVAFGGQGAPLIPYFDYIIFHSKIKNRALLNIGGISNISIIRKNSAPDDVIAFDTGPGNMLSDYLSKNLFNCNFDKNGKIALSGNIDDKLFTEILKKDIFIYSAPPKSTGREYYNEKYIQKFIKKYPSLKPEDLLATIANITPFAVYTNYEKFIKPNCVIDELIISGGGAKNKFFLKQLKKYFGTGISVKNIDDFGISSDSKEAVCFAVLANETISGNPVNIPRVTGALQKTILGKICLP